MRPVPCERVLPPPIDEVFRVAVALAELRRVVVLQLIPRNELCELDPAIVTREFAAKRQEEIFERELMTMLTPVHVENSGARLGSDRPAFAHFTVKKCRYPLHCSGSDLIQEALIYPSDCQEGRADSTFQHILGSGCRVANGSGVPPILRTGC
jgi:hypothetical protein